MKENLKFFFASPGTCSIYLNKTFTYKCYFFYLYLLVYRFGYSRKNTPSPPHDGWVLGDSHRAGARVRSVRGGGVRSVCFFSSKTISFSFRYKFAHRKCVDGWMDTQTYIQNCPSKAAGKELGMSFINTIA